MSPVPPVLPLIPFFLFGKMTIYGKQRPTKRVKLKSVLIMFVQVSQCQFVCQTKWKNYLNILGKKLKISGPNGLSKCPESRETDFGHLQDCFRQFFSNSFLAPGGGQAAGPFGSVAVGRLVGRACFPFGL